MSPTPRLQTPASRTKQGRRFPITFPVEYVIRGCRYQGTTSEIGSDTMTLITDRILPVLQPIEVFIDWPSRFDGRCSVQVCITGRVHTSNNVCSNVSIVRHRFRLRPTPLAKVG
jgi:hypothetical protein